LLLLLFSNVVNASDKDSFEEYLQYIKDEGKIIRVSTKSLRYLYDAPAIVTVISRDEILNSGAKKLVDILKHIPGFGITENAQGNYDIETRGMKTFLSEKVLIMLNGKVLNNVFTGGATWVHENLNLREVQKIEIIRGPGSALYGANAFAVVNIITISEKRPDEYSFSSSLGSFGTKDYHLFLRKRYSDDIIVQAYGSLYKTDGFKVVDNSFFDGRYTNADESNSFKLNLQYKGLETNFDLTARDNNFDNSSFGLYDQVVNAKFYEFTGDVKYHYGLRDNLEIIPRFYYNRFSLEMDLDQVFTSPALPAVQGFLIEGRTKQKNETFGVEIQTDYNPIGDHRFIVGTVHEYIRQFDTGLDANIDFATLSTKSSVQEVPNFTKDADRKLWGFYGQYELPTKYVNITLGGRYDHYSDFGGTFNPRSGVVVKPAEWLSWKLLYSEAYRAPSFTEMYSRNNFTLIGNDDLKAEKLKSWETGFEFKAGPMNLTSNFFYNEVDNLIFINQAVAPATYKNSDSTVFIKGVESELKFRYSEHYAYINHTYQHMGRTVYGMPVNKGSFGITIVPLKNTSINLEFLYIGKRKREVSDTRDAVKPYLLTDVTFTKRKLFDHVNIKGLIRNLFNQHYNDPTPLVNGLAGQDTRRAGATYMIELEYEF
ncbi:MAG: TonB-dependent receptor plug domain-containing protein, partial [Candidatus Zixiibacteriota bacterium]